MFPVFEKKICRRPKTDLFILQQKAIYERNFLKVVSGKR
jgi:hypothetical protein